MRILWILSLVALIACGSNDTNEKRFHPDAEALQIEALKVYHRKPDSALAVLDKAIQMDPSFYLAYNTKATVLITEGKYQRAVAELMKSLHWETDQPEVHLQLGMIQTKLSLPERAEEHFISAQALFDNRMAEDSRFRVQDEINRAITLVMLGKTNEGNRLLDSLISAHPGNKLAADLHIRRTGKSSPELDKGFYISELLENK